MHRKWMLPLLLAVTLLVFGITLGFSFMGDDYPQIVQNARVQSWSGVPSYFTTHLWSQLPQAVARFYRPFFLLSLRLIHALFGFWTPGWHLVLLLLHLVTVASVYWLMRQWKSAETALLGSALFALHPVHAEVVSWLSALSEPCMAAALVASLVYARRSGVRSLAMALGFFAAALLFKETAIVWPLVVLIALWDGPATSLRRTLPFVAVAAGYLAVRLAVLGSLNRPLERAVQPDPAYVPTALGQYLLHLVWPVGLSTYCELTPSWWYLLLVLPLLGVLLWLARRGVYERAAVAILLLPLLPTLNLGSLQLDALVQDRYLYLPSVGFAMLAALLLVRLPRPALAALGLLLVVGCVRETLTWSDGEHFYARGLQAAPHNPEVREGLGRLYASENRYAEAITVLEPLAQDDHAPATLRANGLYTLGYSHEQLGQLREALTCFAASDSIRRQPQLEQHILWLRSNLPGDEAR